MTPVIPTPLREITNKATLVNVRPVNHSFVSCQLRETLVEAAKVIEDILSKYRGDEGQAADPSREPYLYDEHPDSSHSDEDDDEAGSISAELELLETVEESMRLELAEAENLWRSNSYLETRNASLMTISGSLPDIVRLSDSDESTDTENDDGWSENSTTSYTGHFRGSEMRAAQRPPVEDILCSALLQTGHGGMSLALASDILAARMLSYSMSSRSILRNWLSQKMTANDTLAPSWTLGVPLLGSASTSQGNLVWLLSGELSPSTNKHAESDVHDDQDDSLRELDDLFVEASLQKLQSFQIIRTSQ